MLRCHGSQRLWHCYDICLCLWNLYLPLKVRYPSLDELSCEEHKRCPIEEHNRKQKCFMQHVFVVLLLVIFLSDVGFHHGYPESADGSIKQTQQRLHYNLWLAFIVPLKNSIAAILVSCVTFNISVFPFWYQHYIHCILLVCKLLLQTGRSNFSSCLCLSQASSYFLWHFNQQHQSHKWTTFEYPLFLSQ